MILRGIHVGGKKKVPMAELRGSCEDAGFGDVTTHASSGVGRRPSAALQVSSARVWLNEASPSGSAPRWPV